MSDLFVGLYPLSLIAMVVAIVKRKTISKSILAFAIVLPTILFIAVGVTMPNTPEVKSSPVVNVKESSKTNINIDTSLANKIKIFRNCVEFGYKKCEYINKNKMNANDFGEIVRETNGLAYTNAQNPNWVENKDARFLDLGRVKYVGFLSSWGLDSSVLGYRITTSGYGHCIMGHASNNEWMRYKFDWYLFDDYDEWIELVGAYTYVCPSHKNEMKIFLNNATDKSLNDYIKNKYSLEFFSKSQINMYRNNIIESFNDFKTVMKSEMGN